MGTVCSVAGKSTWGAAAKLLAAAAASASHRYTSASASWGAKALCVAELKRCTVDPPHDIRTLPVLGSLQWLHRLEVGITRGAEGKTGRAFVGDMSEEKAVELASKVVSEGFLYGVRMGAGRPVLLLCVPTKLWER